MSLLLAVLGASASAARAQDVRVSVDPERLGQRVEPRFVGLSFEASALPQLARGANRGNLVALLRSLGPGILRFGGASLDTNTAFSTTGAAQPWATTTITPRDLARLGRLARRSGWSVLLGLPLGRHDPKLAAREAAVAKRELGPALAGVQVGNEPNAFWVFGLRPSWWGYAEYRRELGSYRRALAAAAPGIPLAGPDTALYDGFDWLRMYARDERPAILTPHYYPHHGCFGPPATVPELLGPALSRREASAISTHADIARTARLPMRLGETNNVPCGGQTGVSDTFSTALWALRYMVRLARAGFAGVNFHGLPEHCRGYAPICSASAADLRRGRLRAMPEWYALLMFRHLVGERLAGTTLSRRPDGLTVAAFRARSERSVHVLAVNTSATERVRLSVRLRGADGLRRGHVLRLTGPALEAKTGVTLGGARVGRGGRWSPADPRPGAAARGGTFRTVVRAGSAALIRLERP